MDAGYCYTKVPLPADSSFLGFLLNYFLNGLLSEDSQNAFKDYTLVLLPYCSGDLFMGTPHGIDGLNHNGANMTFTVLNWVTDVFPAANNILISGSSAGGIAALVYSSVFDSAFSNRPNITYFSDSAVYPHFDGKVLSDAVATDKRLIVVQSCLDEDFTGAEWFNCMVLHNSYPGVFFIYTDDEVQKAYHSLWESSDDWSCKSAGLLELLSNSSLGSVGYYTKIGIGHGISNTSEFFEPNAEGVSPHDFVIDAVNRKVCSYKNFSLEFLDSCEYKVSNVTGFCPLSREESGGSNEEESEKKREEIKKSTSQVNYVLFGVAGLVTISLLLYAVRFFFKRRKAKGYRRHLENPERITLNLVATN